MPDTVRLYRWTLTAAFLLVLVGAGGWLAARSDPGGFHGTTYEPVAPAPDFALVDHRGHAATRASLEGSPALLFFGYTSCPDVCPRTLQRLARLTRDLPELRIVLVTVDPAHDTPRVMRDYVRRFGPQVTGLTGDSAAVARAMAAYGAYTLPPGHGAHGAAAASAIGHSAVLYGLDRQGNLRVVISEGASEREIRDDARHLARL